MKYTAPVLWAAVSCLAAAAHAVPVSNGTGLIAPGQTITFETVPLGVNEPVSNQFASLGITFTSNAWANPDASSYPNVTGNRIANFVSNSGFRGSALVIAFSAPVSEVAFALVTANGGISTVAAYLNGSVVESDAFATSTTEALNFHGFRNIVFDEIRISTASFDNALVIDNLQTVTAVPEASTPAILSAGLLLIGLAVRRRRSLTD